MAEYSIQDQHRHTVFRMDYIGTILYYISGVHGTEYTGKLLCDAMHIFNLRDL